MAFKLYFLAFILLTSLKSMAEISPILNIPKARSDLDLSQDYHKQLLLLALNKAANGRAIPTLNSVAEMSQGRARQELFRGNLIDVYWLGTSIIDERDLRAIKVPTTKGLIGYRKFIIKKQSIAKFDQIKNLAQLKSLTACQGSHWPDTLILKQAGLPVITTSTYENLFSMLNANRCDYFPRGYHDLEKEVEVRKNLYPDLIAYHRILLHYPFAVYFFTRKENEDLALWIEAGMQQLAKEGAIEALMKRHGLTAHVFPLINDKTNLYLNIENPLLTQDTNYKNPDAWFIPADFK
ncbi:transporter substrate-binding domain-containing protein [Catenovulum maritimum]|uniref:Uncharacterized protein n=1 Tax=Catenovulum maritimum TaxID=1513271 RepID=A0A0J8GUD8_9ALTE|nr:transporter substrate-binding domain-containing protein [Catenovulum maritimum]KMT64924.1 hypothetical protein XM47_11995 [Catenovulum maritimum]